jgi:hypothetical protein
LKTELPDPSRIRTLLSRYSPVRLAAATDHLDPRDRQALGQLIDAAGWINRIYWKQRSVDGWSLRQRVGGLAGEQARQLQRLLDINFGPWDGFSGDEPFWGNERRPPGGDFYPPDLTRAEFQRYLDHHPEQRRALLSHTTLVRRQGDRLLTISYEQAYREELAQVAHHLRAAGELVSHARFGAFLRARALGLLTGSLGESEAGWIDVADSPIDIAIGPYEVYDDELMGLKASYEATVMVRHPTTERLLQYETVAGELERHLPGVVAPPPTRRRFVVGVYDVVYAAGMTNMGGKAMAATLPNDERVRSEVGARLLLFQNVIAAKFEPILAPLAARVLHPEQASGLSAEAFLVHTLLHEMAHAVSGSFVMDGGPPRTINEALQERYSTVEECRADLVGQLFLDLLVRRGTLPAGLGPGAAITVVASTVRSLRFGVGDDHSRGAAIILSHLLRTGVVRLGADDRLDVDAAGVSREVGALAARVHGITVRGDYAAAGDLIDALGSMPAGLERLLRRCEDVPVDLEFVFEDSAGLG